jgi:hypothetical protein
MIGNIEVANGARGNGAAARFDAPRLVEHEHFAPELGQILSCCCTCRATADNDDIENLSLAHLACSIRGSNVS